MKWRKEDGQSTVEFALILPILILLIFGLIDFGWLFYNKIEVNNASREGARYAAVHWSDPTCSEDTKDTIMRFTDIDESGISIATDAAVKEVTVTVNKNVRVLTGITSTFLGETTVLNSSCTMRIE